MWRKSSSKNVHVSGHSEWYLLEDTLFLDVMLELLVLMPFQVSEIAAHPSQVELHQRWKGK